MEKPRGSMVFFWYTANMKGTAPVFIAIAAALLIKLLLFDFFIAQGHSMEPAIFDGAVLVISRVSYGIRLPLMKSYLVRWSKPAVGDIVVFYTPEGERAIKRCVQIEGDNFYAEGDNDLASYDSRAYGKVSVEKIIGKVLGH